MINKIINSVVRPRHTWREMKFDELAEIYTSMSLRTFGLGIIGIFVPVFLYNLGFSLRDIFLFFVLFFALRIPLSFLVALIIARIGPKHTIAISTVVLIFFQLSLLTYEIFNWPLIFMSFLFTFANGMFFMAYNVDFSKIQHAKHGGKELGWLYIFERAGGALGPIIGGVIASALSPDYAIALSMIIMIISLIPLFLTKEPVKIHQHIKFRNFHNKDHIRDFISLGGFNVQNVVSHVMWPLLLAVFIFTDDSYAKVGSVIGLTMFISIFSAIMFGKFIDNKKGKPLLHYGIVMDFVLNICRAIVSTTGGAVATSSLGEPVALSYRMPMVKGFYDKASMLEGYRIVYITWGEVWVSVAKGLYCAILFALTFHYDPIWTLRFGFLVAGMFSLLMFVQKFPTLNKRV